MFYVLEEIKMAMVSP